MKTYSSNFWKLSFSMLLFTTSYNIVIPEMNAFLTDLGSPGLKGLIIGLFTISAGFSRPFSGKLSDIIGRKKVMLIGLLISVAVCSLYSFAFAAWFLLTLRFLHGFSVGFYPTGATALITDILPEDKRGFGMGLWGTFISIGMGLGQGLSSFIVDIGNRDALFFTAALFTALSYILYFNVKETLAKPAKFKWSNLQIKSDEIIEPSVIPVAVVMFLSAMCSGIILVLSPDISDHLHIENKGAFFIFYVMATILIRLVTGKVSDTYGRRQTLVVGMVILCISMILIGLSKTESWYYISSIIFGIATGIISPTIFAWTADLSPKNRRGRGTGTMFIALEFGVLSGALSTDLWYQNNLESIWNVFLFGAGMAFLCILYLLWHLKTKKAKH
ncbi:MFS transporter [uncultured Fluviicola sp.]|uniref:MFS transporter n=1 Tax=uncultured Fluviicola sp. TaxID=463303 RepID=UPI0025E8CFE8|nr:MFS transporter [uncultured Fluviicola sp.]